MISNLNVVISTRLTTGTTLISSSRTDGAVTVVSTRLITPL